MHAPHETPAGDNDSAELLLREILQGCSEAIVLVDERGMVAYTNATFDKLELGNVPDTAQLIEALGPDAVRFGRALRSVMKGESASEEAIFFRAHELGKRQWLHAQIKRLATRTAIYLHDATEFQVERQVRTESERRLNHLVNQSPLGVIEWNIHFECTAWNRRAEEIFGFTAEEAIGRHFTDLISHGLVREVVDGYWRELVNKGLPTRNVNENVDKHGNVLVCEWFNLPYFDHEGKFVGVWSLCHDQTEQRRNEQAMQETARALEQKVQEAATESAEKDRLLHELDQKFELIRQQASEITNLSSPILELWEGVVAVPIIGRLDETRSTLVMERLLAAVVDKQSQIVLVDLTGVETLEGESAERLTNILRAVELLGARGILTGVQPAVARTIVEIGGSFGAATSCRSLRDGLRIALAGEKGPRQRKRE